MASDEHYVVEGTEETGFRRRIVDTVIPGEYFVVKGSVSANKGRLTVRLEVKNTGDRPIQVGSHVHFFETNRMLDFPRDQAYGFHLNIPSGTSVRFEPGDVRTVELVKYGGKEIIHGFGGLVHGNLEYKRDQAMAKARQRGYKGA